MHVLMERAMQAILIELILWVALLFFFWALKDNLGRVESELEAPGVGRAGRRAERHARRPGSRRPQRLSEPMGSFRGEVIYRYAVFEGRTYRFDHAWAGERPPELRGDQRWVEPGIVYQTCDRQD